MTVRLTAVAAAVAMVGSPAVAWTLMPADWVETRAQVEADTRSMLRTIDANGDGTVTPAECAVYVAAHARDNTAVGEARVMHFGWHMVSIAVDAGLKSDASVAQSVADMVRLFDDVDTDHDGRLTRPERALFNQTLFRAKDRWPRGSP